MKVVRKKPASNAKATKEASPKVAKAKGRKRKREADGEEEIDDDVLVSTICVAV